MSKTCQVTGKSPITGNTVSHAKNKRRRRFLPNLHKRRIWVPSLAHFVTLKVSSKGLRTIDKLGIEVVLKRLEAGENIN